MEQTVYADLLFMINFSMDLLCMLLVARLLSRRVSLLRMVPAAAIGGLYSVAALFIPSNATGFLLDLAVCILMCLLAFRQRREKITSLLILSAAFLLSSLLLGGIMTAIFHLLNRYAPSPELGGEDGGMPLWLLAPIAALSSLITWLGGRFLRKRAQIREAELAVSLGNRRAVMRAICDSGNLLRDAISGRAVVVADLRYAEFLLPPGCPSAEEWGPGTLGALPSEVADRIRVIPTRTATSEGLLYALRPDAMTVTVGNSSRPTDALIAFAPLGRTLESGSAILPPELLI